MPIGAELKVFKKGEIFELDLSGVAGKALDAAIKGPLKMGWCGEIPLSEAKKEVKKEEAPKAEIKEEPKKEEAPKAEEKAEAPKPKKRASKKKASAKSSK